MADLTCLNNPSRSLPVVVFLLLLNALACTGGAQSSEAAPSAADPEPAASTEETFTTVEPTSVISTSADPTLAVPTLAEDPGAEIERVYCEGAQIHPIGTSIAETYEFPYEDVMALYCSGHKFDEVLLALETEAQSDVAAAEILGLRDAGLSWDQIWRELNLIE